MKRSALAMLLLVSALITGGCVSAGGRGQLELSLRPNVFVFGSWYYPHDRWYLYSPTSSYYRPYPFYPYGYGWYAPPYYFCPPPPPARRGCETPPSPQKKESPRPQPESSPQPPQSHPAASSSDERRFLFFYI